MPRVDIAIGITPHSVAVVDVNDDGLADLVAAGSGVASVSVLLGHGDGTFVTHAEHGPLTGAYAIAAGDFDGDGRIDLVTATVAGNTVTLLLGRGDGVFDYRGAYATGDFPFALAAADLNGDGRLDLAVANYNGNTLSTLLNSAGATLDVEPGPARPTGRLAMRAAYPNPARGAVMLRFVLPAAGRVDAEVFDIGGRRVRSLTTGVSLSPGEHALRWDRRDQAGRVLAGCLYLVRIRAGGETAVGRVMLIQ